MAIKEMKKTQIICLGDTGTGTGTGRTEIMYY